MPKIASKAEISMVSEAGIVRDLATGSPDCVTGVDKTIGSTKAGSAICVQMRPGALIRARGGRAMKGGNWEARGGEERPELSCSR